MDDVGKVIHSLLPDAKVRRVCLEAFDETARYANSLGSEKWGAYYERGKVRLLVGSLIVFTLEPGCIWLALDQELLEKSQELSDFLESIEDWQWDNHDYPRYTKVPSRNGFYTPSEQHANVWSVIEQLHFEFISKAAAKYEKLRKSTQHSGSLIDYIRGEINGFLQSSADKQPEISEAVEVLRVIAGKPRKFSGQGFQSSPEARRAIELRAMQLAINHFQQQGWIVEDVSKYESYDLLCTRQVEKLYVEVKGTTSEGSKILMTYQEVIHTQRNYPHTALFVASQIELINSEAELEAIGGEIKLYQPWLLSDDSLKAIAYEYQVSNDNAV
jgi:hypothetical protein